MTFYPLHFIWTAFVLLLETLAYAFWPLFAWVLFGLGLFLSGFNTSFGDGAQAYLTLVFYSGALTLTWKGARKFTWPNRHKIRRRIEKASALEHAPLTSQNDSLTQGSQKLWQSYKAFLNRSTAALKFTTPRDTIAQHDPKRLRFIALLVFICGALLAGEQFTSRLHDTLTLHPAHLVPDIPARPDPLTAWITPPDYTGLSQTKITATNDTLIIPEGSSVKATLTKSILTPTLNVNDTDLDITIFEHDFHALDLAGNRAGNRAGYLFEGSFDNARPDSNYVLSIKHGLFSKFSVPFKILEDHPPTIAIQNPPVKLPLGLMRIPVTVSDDYGVTSITLKTELANIGRATTPLGRTYTETRGLSTTPNEQRSIEYVYDLTAHPWAGLAVNITLIAEDAAGHTSTSSPISMILPKRDFKHPLARELMTYRNGLIWKPQEDHFYIAGKLNQILNTPQLFNGDIVTTLALRSASSRLYYTPQHNEARLKTAESLIPLLWYTALKIEDGNLTLAAQNLQDAQNALQNALNDSQTSDAEIQELIQNVQNALMQYMAEMSRELMKRAQNGDSMMINPDMLESVRASGVMEDLMAEIQEKIAQGDKKGAQDLLSQLQEFMSSMNPSMAMKMPQDMQDMQEAMNKIKELIAAQKDLRDQTQTQADSLKDFLQNKEVARQYQQQIQQAINQLNLKDPAAIQNILRQMPKPKTSAPPQINTSDLASDQNALNDQLQDISGEITEKIGQAPQELNSASGEMQQASETLKGNAPIPSVNHQNQALEYLEKAGESMSQQFQQKMQQMAGQGMRFMMGGGPRMQYDPFGRPMNPDQDGEGGLNSRDLKLPNGDQRKQAREIQRLLRERSGDATRPREERDYLRRLLKQF